MKLYDWDIWHTYATYFTKSIADLDKAAQRLVRHRVAECAVLRDGRFYWWSDNRLQLGTSAVLLHPSRRTATTTVTPGYPPGFAGEALHQALVFRFAEKRLLGETGQLPPPYVRAYVGECRLRFESELVIVYPIVTLYESGVVLVEMRLLAPEEAIEHPAFIARYVNLFESAFDEIWTSPGIVELTGRTHWEWGGNLWPIWRRLGLVLGNRRWRRSVRQFTRPFEDASFSFELAPLYSRGQGRGVDENELLEPPLPQHTEDTSDRCGTPRCTGAAHEAEEFLSFTDLAHAVILAATFAISAPRSSIPLLVFGQRRLIPLGNFWSARPHIHVLRHEDQQDDAFHNAEHHGGDFGCILARTPEMDAQLGRQFLPENARLFGDFSAYVPSQTTLWVWARNGLDAQEAWADPNRGHLIYANQVQCELLDYGYMLHRQFAEQATSLPTTDYVLQTRKELTKLEMQMPVVGPYGEIRELFEKGWRALGVDRLRSEVAALLAVREAETATAETRKTNQWSALLTILFGMVAVPPIATEVIKPACEKLGCPLPGDPNAAQLLNIGLAVGLVLFLLGGSRFVIWLIARMRP